VVAENVVVASANFPRDGGRRKQSLIGEVAEMWFRGAKHLPRLVCPQMASPLGEFAAVAAGWFEEGEKVGHAEECAHGGAHVD
jgi:hypothetical protein